MSSNVGGILIVFLVLSVPRAESEERPGPSSAVEQYRALVKEYSDTSAEFRKARTDQERKTAVEHLERFPRMFVDLAERNSKDPIALDVVVEAVRAINALDSLTQTAWDMNTTSFPAGGKDDSAGRAVGLLLRDHLRSEKLGPVCQRMSYSIRKEYETFLRTVLKTNPHKDVQALACLALTQILSSRVQKLDLVKDRPELAGRYEGLFGREYFQELQRQAPARITREVETLLEQALSEYGDVKLPFSGTVGEEAREALFEIRHQAIGQEAPDIEGKDQDGRQFKLSDYRGKVVLLDFWLEY